MTALVTGAARGQGRSHAIRMAQEGANVIATDACQPITSIPYPLASKADLDETERLIAATGAGVVTHIADVRDQDTMDAAVTAGIDRFGRLDIICANAGVLSMAPSWQITETQWADLIDINLGGVWRTTKAAVPAMLQAGNGGSVILISSTAHHRGVPNISHYVAAKHGVVGLMKSLATST
ncbi:SDR family NAD(P)-dependent oxidoreductase (plasmid) [Rhodococcus sp. USK10]|uniref:SDR family NAD(P)-dependent oxidoreductase n=1 Tax=Rhodococcus sp. USK10 TaxID=2789739 RepID=UPI001C5FD650|nr:SDR family NAD(P)-dependent oxidoreductase [Rhodococcus sp. USK10]QYB00197.1 SDR family NAD(P)-dependent oxidoreductase [Rhodococcus sp. USK10]